MIAHPRIARSRPFRSGSLAPARRGRAGFSLLELLVALAALTLVALLAIPAHFGRSEVTLVQAARVLVADLEDVRTLSVTGMGALRFDVEADGYQVMTEAGDVLFHPRSGLPFVRSYSRDAIFRGVRVDLGGLKETDVAFDVHGYCTGADQIVLEYRGASAVVVEDSGRWVVRSAPGY